MKKIFTFILTLAATAAWAAPNPAEYTVNVHVVSSRVETLYYSNTYVRSRILNVVVGGHKYELTDSSGNSTQVLALGDYKAKVVETGSKTKQVDGRPSAGATHQAEDDPTNAYLINAMYEFLFPDQKTEKFAVSGVME